ncbi:MAG: hypothetical protein KBS62_07190 [Oscillospiraceae bacterium]|nr:hypothetical protein [Candidatus Ruminococcus equi]
MKKRILSAVLCIVMVLTAFSIVPFSVSAVDTANGVDTGAEQIIKFDPSGTGWSNYKYIFCHIWVYGGDPLTAWQAKASKMTKVSDTEWTYDVSKSGSSISTDGTPYAVIFSNENGMQTYDLLFDSSVLGDTAYCNADEEIKNPADSSKTCKPAYWKGQDPAKYGPVKTITFIGNIVGSCIPSTTTPYKMFVDFLKNNLSYAQLYSDKDDQAILDDVAGGLGLYRRDVENAIIDAGVLVNWSRNKSSLLNINENGYISEINLLVSSLPWESYNSIFGEIVSSNGVVSSGAYISKTKEIVSFENNKFSLIYTFDLSNVDMINESDFKIRFFTDKSQYTPWIEINNTSFGDFIYYESGEYKLGAFNNPNKLNFENTRTGIKISWSAARNASKYRLLRYANNNNWETVCETSALSFEDKNVNDGEKYTYMVCGLDSAGNILDDENLYDDETEYFQPPVIESLTNTKDGIKISWNPTKGYESYRVYCKVNGAADWTRVGDTEETSFVYTDVKKGDKYTFTIRHISKDKSVFLSSFDQTGKSIVYDEPHIIIILGDADKDGTLSVIDATCIQKYLADLITESDIDLSVCDTDHDSTISVLDATRIQKFLAGLIEEM